MKDAVIVAVLRTPVGKAPRGRLRMVRPETMAAVVIRAALGRLPGLAPSEVDDVILGCAMPEAEQGMNVARIAALVAGLPPSVPGLTVNRFCASGLEAIARAVERISLGAADVILAGGVESMSMVPMGGHRLVPSPDLVKDCPQAYITMGLTAEHVQSAYGISREEQDQFACNSHGKAVAAMRAGRFQEEIVPVPVKERTLDAEGTLQLQSATFDADEGPRPDTTLDALAGLAPVFKHGGTVTAGNASQMSDGAAIAVVMSQRKALALGVPPLARLVSYTVVGAPPEIMGMGPVWAIPRALAAAGLRLEQIDLIELNEAFAVQALAVIKEARLDPARVNVNGGAVALGHPLGCTGAKITATLLHELRRRGDRYGLATLCVGGGQGVAGVFELVQ